MTVLAADTQVKREEISSGTFSLFLTCMFAASAVILEKKTSVKSRRRVKQSLNTTLHFLYIYVLTHTLNAGSAVVATTALVSYHF